MTQAKICGLSTPETVDSAVRSGAAFIGFNFFPGSPRYVTPSAAARLAERVRGRTRIVAVTVDPDDALLDELAEALSPDLIQLHGRESPARVADIRRRVSAGLIKVMPVSGAGDLADVDVFEPLADHLMFDAKPPTGAPMPGGLGMRFDAALLAGRRFARPWFLAGGLDPWNVAEAIAQSGAPLVDVSSGVERGAGLKDPALIEAFLEAVRRA